MRVAGGLFAPVCFLTGGQVPCSSDEPPLPAGDPAEFGLTYQREMHSKEVAVCTVGELKGRKWLRGFVRQE